MQDAIQEENNDHNINVDISEDCLITIEEVKSSLKSMKNNKSQGPDDIAAEVIKACGEKMIECLHILYNLAYSCGVVPSDWNESFICTFFKKGDPAVCENHRGISLMSHIAKIYERILEKKSTNFCGK